MTVDGPTNLERRWRRALPAALGLVALCARVPGASATLQEPPRAPASPTAGPAAAVPSATEFESGFRAAADLMTRRRWKEAREAWLVLLRRHAGLEHARPRLAEIREALRKCAFWSATKEPDAKAVVKGDLRSYSESSGQMEIVYRHANLGDLDLVADQPGLFLHPVTFRGPYRIELEGPAEQLVNASLIVAFDAGNGYIVQIGGITLDLVYHHRILRLASEPEVVDDVTPAPGGGKKRKDGARSTIRVQVKVDADSITYTYDGEKLLETRNERRTLGRWGLQAGEPFGELVVRGAVEPSWIDGRKDAFVQSARDAFDRTYKDPLELAAWSVEPPEKASAAIASVLGSFKLPPVDSREGVRIVERVGTLRSEGRAEEAAAFLRESEPGAVPSTVRELLLALCAAESDQPMRALAHLREYERWGDMPRPLRYLKASLLGAVEREADAVPILEGLVGEEPSDGEPHLQLTGALLGLGRFDDARIALERALQHCGPSPAIEEVRVQLAKAQVGPEWRRKYAQSSEHFEVASDIDVASCAMAARELEETWKKCGEWLGASLAPAAKPTRVYLFSGEASYLGYIRGVVRESSENTLGVYSTLIVQIVAWNSADKDSLQHTLRHEGVHHYLHRALGELPIWLDEGLAEYVASSNVSTSKWLPGAMRPLTELVLRDEEERLTDLWTFLNLDHDGFMQHPERHYAQAWAVVHFLRHGKSAEGERFYARLWQALVEPTDAASALTAALEGIDVPALEQQFRAHVTAVLAESGKR